MAFTATGVRTMALSHLTPGTLPMSISLDSRDPTSVDAQLAQFLRATRKLDLAEKKKEVRLRTITGARKRAYSASDWDQVGAALGFTSILSLLYRKRIKANYRDIDSLLHEEIDAEALYRHLLRVVGALNFVHEAYIALMLGCGALENAVDTLPRGMAGRPRGRIPHLLRLTT